MRGALRLLGALVVLASAARAETGPGLVLRPWDEGKRLEVEADVEAYLDGRVRGGPHLDLRRYEARGRLRFATARGEGPPGREGGGRTEPAAGLEMRYLDLDTAAPQLPVRLVETRAALGFPVGEVGGWSIDATVGVGHASDEPFGDGKGWHALANVLGRYRVARGKSWLVGLNYDGNRAIWPDLPLPLVAYQRFLGPDLRFSVGFPFNSVTWRPAPRWTIEVRGIPPISLEGGVTFAARDDLDLFVLYDNRRDAFHLDGTSRTRRLFFQQRRLEAGATWRPRAGVALTLAGGWAFDQVFTFGFDVRDDDTTVARLDHDAYVRVRGVFTF